jgi:hypothetical protein
MVSEIFESLFWVGPGFIPKSHLVESLSNDNEGMEKAVKRAKHSSSNIISIKSKATIFTSLSAEPRYVMKENEMKFWSPSGSDTTNAISFLNHIITLCNKFQNDS